MTADPTYDHIVIGVGPIGAATARHLAERGDSVLVIGPEEPAGFADHQGTWAGHYDQGRMCHVLEIPVVTGMLTTRSIRRFPELTRRTGVEFTTDVECLSVNPADAAGDAAGEWFDRDVLAANARDLGVDVHLLDEEGLRRRYPAVRFEPGHVGVVQPGGMIVNPRALVRAELAAASAAGAVLVRDEVVALEGGAGGGDDSGDDDDKNDDNNHNDDDKVVVTAGGVRLRGRSIVLALGAAVNASGLLPRPLQLFTLGATVVLVEVDDPGGIDLPATMYLKHRDGAQQFGGVVMSPVRYPDGRWYLKVAGSSVRETPLGSAEEIASWVRTGGASADVDDALAVLTDLLPGVRLGRAHTRPCLVCATSTNHPYIDRVDDRTVLAVEGERGVMAADEIGRLTADLAATGRWTDPLPRDVFRARWAA
ncbi:FAD-binding oxidoreductase [Dietzia kunjamensis]|uniref:NAD(P)/FAD-dependent oxidoreductase n=1 Tax=Dietzia kunjamensis TaxID=322509 RepID=UPI002DBBC2BE|nr:FAD-binding oxidoreductase [Dietzia kunjamensis]MEB8326523.1 FAD-binding oxidoreductase [Dietzia kunjamensis]